MNPYRIVHKALRRELTTLVVDAGRLATTDTSAVAGLIERWRNVRVLLDAHHRHEDVYIGPELLRAQPALFGEMESDHQMLQAKPGRRISRAPPPRTRSTCCITASA